MADATDFSGYIIAPQDFSGLYKLGDTLAAQKVAKAKAAADKDAKNKVLGAYVNSIDDKDFLTGTIEDPYITGKVYDLRNKLYGIIKSTNGDISQNELEAMYTREAKDIAISSQNIKEVKRRADEAETDLKTNPGADIKLFRRGHNQLAFMNPDGTIKDISKIDPTVDYVSQTQQGYPMWNASGIDAMVKGAGRNTNTVSSTVKDANGKLRSIDLETTAPAWMIPVLDEKGVFQKDFEPRHEFATVDGKIKQIPKTDTYGNALYDANKNPIMEQQKIVNNQDWEMLGLDKASAPYLRQEMSKYAQQKGLPITDIEVENYGRNLGYKLLDRSSKSFSSHKAIDKKIEAQAPKITVNVGGKGDEPYRDMAKEIGGIFKEGEAHAGGLGTGKGDPTKGALFTYSVANLETDTGDHLVEVINKRYPGRKKKYDADELYIVRNTAGTLEVRSNRGKDNNEFLMPVSTALNIGGQVSGGGRKRAVRETESENMATGITPKIVGKAKSGTSQTKAKKTDPLGLGL